MVSKEDIMKSAFKQWYDLLKDIVEDEGSWLYQKEAEKEGTLDKYKKILVKCEKINDNLGSYEQIVV